MPDVQPLSDAEIAEIEARWNEECSARQNGAHRSRLARHRPIMGWPIPRLIATIRALQRRMALDRMVRASVDDGTYDIVPTDTRTSADVD